MRRRRGDPKRRRAAERDRIASIETFANEWVGVRARPHRRRRARAGARSRPTTPTSPRWCCTARWRRTRSAPTRSTLDGARRPRARGASTSSRARYLCRALGGRRHRALGPARQARGRAACARCSAARRGRLPPTRRACAATSRPADEAAAARRGCATSTASTRSSSGSAASAATTATSGPGRTEAIVPAVRRALGDDATLLVDANSCYSPARAIEVGRLLEAAGRRATSRSRARTGSSSGRPRWREALDLDVAGGEQDCFLRRGGG